MANNENALNALLNVGLRQRELNNVLASNCVLDWFGRTLKGRSKVVNFYFNSNNCYEHSSMLNAETIDAFEERSTHLSTRDQPLDNVHKPPELNSNEQWYDCETHSPVNIKDTNRTPSPKRPSQVLICPPAPHRRSLLKNSSDEDDEKIGPLDESFEEGICPLDGPLLKFAETEQIPRSPDRKRQRQNDESDKKSEFISLEQSRYSALHYLEATGVVTVRRQASSSSSPDEYDRRECKMQISYRVNKAMANDIQIALIVYKNNSSNIKSRRNLMLEFKDDVETSANATVVNLTPSSQTQFSVREKIISTAPAGEKKQSTPMKRSNSSRNCLRF